MLGFSSSYQDGDGFKHNTRYLQDLSKLIKINIVKAFKKLLNDNKKVARELCHFIVISAY